MTADLAGHTFLRLVLDEAEGVDTRKPCGRRDHRKPVLHNAHKSFQWLLTNASQVGISEIGKVRTKPRCLSYSTML